MKKYSLIIKVKFKSGVLDPQGETIKNALLNLGYSGIANVSTGKMFKVELEANSKAEALKTAKEAADRLLANTVIEDFEVEPA